MERPIPPRFHHLTGQRRGEIDTLPADLPDHGALIGRDAEHCAVHLHDEEEGVSRRQAQVWQQGGRWWLRDLDSPNGTSLNGTRLQGDTPVLLSDDAVIVLADRVRLRFESGDGRSSAVAPKESSALPAKQLAMAGLLLLLIMVGMNLYTAHQINQEGKQVEQEWARLEQDKEAFYAEKALVSAPLWGLMRERNVQAEQNPQLQEDSPIEQDPEFQKAYERYAAMDQERGPELFQGNPLAQHAREMVGLLIGDENGRSVDRSFLWEVEEELINALYNQDAYCRLQVIRPELIPILEEELRELGDPTGRAEVLLYLAWIESSFDPKICSSAGARGMWQFITESANKYGVVVEGTVDERCDWRKVTRAAVRHIHDGFEECGADYPFLAVATYNTGLTACAIARREEIPESDRDYIGFVARGYLVNQTSHYLPKLIAASFVGRDRDAALEFVRRKNPGLQFPLSCGTPTIPASEVCPQPPSCRVTILDNEM